MTEITLSLKEIKAHKPCREGWQKALKALGKKRADDTRISFGWIVENNGVDDATWALRCLPVSEYWRVNLFLRSCAAQPLARGGNLAPQMIDWLRTGTTSDPIWPTLTIAAAKACGVVYFMRNIPCCDTDWQAQELLRIMSLDYSPEALILELPTKETERND